MPQALLKQTSTLPSRGLLPLTSRTAPSTQSAEVGSISAQKSLTCNIITNSTVERYLLTALSLVQCKFRVSSFGGGFIQSVFSLPLLGGLFSYTLYRRFHCTCSSRLIRTLTHYSGYLLRGTLYRVSYWTVSNSGLGSGTLDISQSSSLSFSTSSASNSTCVCVYIYIVNHLTCRVV